MGTELDTKAREFVDAKCKLLDSMNRLSRAQAEVKAADAAVAVSLDAVQRAHDEFLAMAELLCPR